MFFGLKFKNNLHTRYFAFIAPENSRICSTDCFEIIENDIAKLTADLSGLAFCLVGDFNAKTANLTDLFMTDENIIDAQHSKRALIRVLEIIFATNIFTRMILVSLYSDSMVVYEI